MRLAVAAVFVTLGGCGLVRAADTAPSYGAQDVIDSWRGVELIVLERHPLFSYRLPVMRTLSDGTESWTYSSCRQVVESSGGVVRNNVFGTDVATTRSSTESREECCVSEFFLDRSAKRILEYRPRGCATDCSAAPYGCAPGQQ